MSARRVNADELSRDKIISKARFLFEEKGYRAVSMRSIAAELGRSHGALYYHFKNKEQLFYGMIEEDFAQLNQIIDMVMASEEHRAQKLRTLFLRFIEYGLNNQNQYEFMFLMKGEGVDGLMQSPANESYEKFAQAVFKLMDRPPAIYLVWSAFLSLHGFVSHFLGYAQSYSEAEAAAENHVTFVLRGLGNEGSC
ncbi:TetR/AcrR family transcriptional regulator [Cytobacillus gottheilii]|uniref:TetR/AcrR family transcriptional regulator n=1 Tax=Cytobacillus gottheilii TaxID=859144 RepID=UPI002495A2FE|nr:TetR/AcrR family transcriptional regulator [Cytobacillus gottheilii]